MKVLILTKKFNLTNTGGPMGYCYNIKSYLDEHPCEDIDFYPGSECYDSVPKITKESRSSLKGKLSFFLSKNKYTAFLTELYRQYFKRVPLSIADKELLQKYDFVHVHWAYDVFQTFSNFNNGKTKVILTTHTPEPLFDELVGRFGVHTLVKKLPFIRNYFLKREVKAYENVELVLFPALEAKEPYINKSLYHKKIFEQIENKTFYVPTAINDMNVAPVNKHCLDAFKIPEDALKVCYVGRHNEVKGYDFLKNIAIKTWVSNPKVYFIIGGKEEPMKGLRDPRWIELGWVNTCELLNEIDVFILPNKETYFDIILLEVLRQGIPVLITRTGGNKWFEKKCVAGMLCFDYGNVDEGVEKLMDAFVAKNNDTERTSKKQIFNFFVTELSMSRFIQNYIETLNKFIDVN